MALSPYSSIPWDRKPSSQASAWWSFWSREGVGCTGCSAACRCFQRYHSGHGEDTQVASSGDLYPSACDDGYFYPAKDSTFTRLQTDYTSVPINYLDQIRLWLKGSNQVKDSILEQLFLADTASTLGHYKEIRDDLIYFSLQLLSPFRVCTFLPQPWRLFNLYAVSGSGKSCNGLEAKAVGKVCRLKTPLPLKCIVPETTQRHLPLFSQKWNVKIKCDLALSDYLGCSLEEAMRSLSHAIQCNPPWEKLPLHKQFV